MTFPSPLPEPIIKFQRNDQIFIWTLRVYYILAAIISILELFTNITVLIPVLLLALLSAIYTATFLYASINHDLVEKLFKKYDVEPLNHEGAMVVLTLLLFYIPVQAIGPIYLNIAFLLVIIFLGEYYSRKKSKAYQGIIKM